MLLLPISFTDESQLLRTISVTWKAHNTYWMNESLLFPTWLVLVNQELISFHFLTWWSRPWSLCSLTARGSFQRFVGVVCTHVQFLSLSSLFQSVFTFISHAAWLHQIFIARFLISQSLSLLSPFLSSSSFSPSFSLPSLPLSLPFLLPFNLHIFFFLSRLPPSLFLFSLLCKTTMQKQYSYWENLEAPQRNTNCAPEWGGILSAGVGTCSTGVCLHW